MYMRVSLHMCVSMRVLAFGGAHARICACVWVQGKFMCAHNWMSLRECDCVYVHMLVCTYTHVLVCVRVCAYASAHTSTCMWVWRWVDAKSVCVHTMKLACVFIIQWRCMSIYSYVCACVSSRECKCVYAYEFAWVCVHKHLRVCMHAKVRARGCESKRYVYVYGQLNTRARPCMGVRVYVCTCISLWARACVGVCTYVCLC